MFLCAFVYSCPLKAQEHTNTNQLVIAANDSVFKGKFSNKEYNVYIDLDFYHQNKLIQGQEFLGEVPGYFGDYKDARKWIFTDATLIDAHTANLVITNDYGSEDLEATLTYHPEDSTYTLRQGSGSTMKIARNRKWVKIPKHISFK
jgi:hypothetical protein